MANNTQQDDELAKKVQEYFSEYELLSQVDRDDAAYRDLFKLIKQYGIQERLNELLHVYDGDALYFYDNNEDHTSVEKRIKELRSQLAKETTS